MRKTSSTNSQNRHVLVGTCIAHEALSRLALRWKVPVLHAIASGAPTYGELRRALPAITDQMLATRLRDLVAERLVVKREDPPRYTLTESGEEALDIVKRVCAWASRNGTMTVDDGPEPEKQSQKMGKAAPVGLGSARGKAGTHSELRRTGSTRPTGPM